MRTDGKEDGLTQADKSFDPDYAFDPEFPLTAEAEEFYRELCRQIIHAVKRGGFRVWVMREFIGGSLWSLTRFLREMGLENWAAEVMQEEIEAFIGDKNERGRVGEKIARIIMPGSKFGAGTSQAGGSFGHMG